MANTPYQIKKELKQREQPEIRLVVKAAVLYCKGEKVLLDKLTLYIYQYAVNHIPKAGLDYLNSVVIDTLELLRSWHPVIDSLEACIDSFHRFLEKRIIISLRRAEDFVEIQDYEIGLFKTMLEIDTDCGHKTSTIHVLEP